MNEWMNFVSRVYRLCKSRTSHLSDSRQYYQFIRDSEEEESWLTEKQRLIRTADTGRDLNAVLRQLKQHEVRLKNFLI